MSNPFLICHKVRGEPAFDVAIQMPCPECEAQGCHECDDEGYWWIIPTSGHRAYPWWSCPDNIWNNTYVLGDIPPMPPSLPDHYPTRATPTVSLLEALNLHKPSTPSPSIPIARRF